MVSDKEAPGEQILVVDDDFNICRMLAEILKKEGYEAVVCTDPMEAIRTAAGGTFGLALVDINLPAMSGLDLAVRFKHDDPQREVVFITGSSTIDNAVQAIKIGAYDYLRKPFSVAELSLCLKRFQERKALRHRVRLAEQRYFELVQHVPLLIFGLRKDLQLDFVNRACVQILGYTPEQAVATPHWFVERIHAEDRERISRLLRAAFEPGVEPFTSECRLLHQNGHVINAIVKSIPFYEDREHSAPERLEGILVDITDRVFLEKALVQKEKLKTLGAVSAEVAHEIRNPLVSIGGFARRLQKSHPDLPEADIIVRESERLERILDRIKNYLKPVEIFPEECSINDTVKECVDLFSPEIEQRAMACRATLEPALPLVMVDREVLGQICINLIRNAVEAMDAGDILHIKSYQSGQSVHIDFEHPRRKGRPKNPEHIFLPFDEGGESIGLPLCHRLLKNMGGLLTFAEDRQQAVFTVSVPRQ